MKKLAVSIGLVAVCALVVPANAQTTYGSSYGWEDGTGTILGSYGNLVNPLNQTGTVRTGARALQVTESPHSSTPQAYVAYIQKLNDGDTITASFYGYDVSPGLSPSLRIWAHYAQNHDVGSYSGSASGNYSYTAGTGWDQVDWTWTFDSGGGTRNALVIEARLYSYPSTGDYSTDYWIDDLDISVTTTSVGNSILTPGGIVYVPEPASLSLLALGGLALVRRRR